MDLKKEYKKGASLSQEAVRDYLQAVAERGRTDDTLKNYRRSLDKFSSWLPEGTELDKNTLVRYEKDLLEQGVCARLCSHALLGCKGIFVLSGGRGSFLSCPGFPWRMPEFSQN